MWVIYIATIIIIFLLFIMLFVFPIKIEIKDEILPTFNKIKKYKSETVKEKHYLKIKILGFILIFKKDLNKNKKKNDDNKLYKNVSNDPLEMVINSVFNALDKAVTGEKINKALLNSKDIKNFINSIYVKKLKLSLGINLINTILNAYISTLINVVINMFIANNINRFNLKDTKYKTYISGEVYNIKIDSIIHLKLANIIYIIIKIIFKLRKVEKKNVRSKTSNRKFNDDSYDFT